VFQLRSNPYLRVVVRLPNSKGMVMPYMQFHNKLNFQTTLNNPNYYFNNIT
jgi:hypothetical protein